MVYGKGSVEILLAKEFVITDIAEGRRGGKRGKNASKKFVLTGIAEGIREGKCGNNASKRSCRY
jgi:hypothetical protein